MNRVKIAFIINNLDQGGAEKQLSQLLIGLNPKLFEKTIYIYNYKTPLFYKDIENDENILCIKEELKFKNKIRKIVEGVKRIRKFLKTGRYDIVFTVLFMNNFLIRLVAPNSYKNKIVSNVRTSIKFYTKFRIFLEKLQIRNSFLVFNSQKSYNDFLQEIPSKHHNRLYFIHNGYLPPTVPFKRSEELIFGCLGRFNREKNILQAVVAFQKFERIFPGYKLIIQGNFGNQYNEILSNISSPFIEVREKDPNVNEFYKSIRVLIIPSLFEGCSNVLFEALLRNRICIVSEGANTDNFIKHGINGFVYDGSEKELLDSMINITNFLNTPDEYSMIRNGYQYAFHEFNMKHMVNNYEKLFLKVYEGK